ncbi:hypothetical protein GGU11DRAFT_747928 [Lentinula aff. detonsa]|uniref:Uncharacterized protein n=1 Tax=Lentinula aff. detonsa TaxID=2804958 RepID=A0AA38KTV6_9AGAR|nr:hypothetical protein GGU10DRAFT_379895 [Lentinula aff. detonsa]KAJ3794493.1 hypothetical protein GGU11DRAFT_747928 [Lentinula aff. detonsa]
MSEELAQDEADAEDYDLEYLERGRGARDDDEATLRGDEHGHPVGEDSVVFEIGDEEEDMTPITAKSSALTRQRSGPERPSGEHAEEERRGFPSDDKPE